MIEIVQLTSIADSIGAPIEMYTREDILVNIDHYLKKFPKRESPYDIGCQPGEYTDDTQMTIAVARHLMRVEQDGYMPFNFDLFMKDLIDVYDEDETEKGVPRGGHGGFKEVAEQKDKDGRVNFQMMKNDERAYNYEDNILGLNRVGNGSGMRLNPFILSSLTDKRLAEYVIGTTMATHNDTTAVVGNILLVNSLKALYNDNISSKNVIEYSLDWLKGKDDRFSFPISDVKTSYVIFESVKELIPSSGNFVESVKEYTKYLELINKIPDCNNDLTNIDPMIITVENVNHCAKKGGTGLPSNAKQTIGWYHYLVKNIHSCQNVLDIMKRCLLVGGDTDTLAVYVYPISYFIFSRTHYVDNLDHYEEDLELPSYIMDQLKEIDTDLLEKRINKNLIK